MENCVKESVPLTMEQFEVLNKKNCILDEENRRLKSDIRDLQRVILNMCHERYSNYRPNEDLSRLRGVMPEAGRMKSEAV